LCQEPYYARLASNLAWPRSFLFFCLLFGQLPPHLSPPFSLFFSISWWGVQLLGRPLRPWPTLGKPSSMLTFPRLGPLRWHGTAFFSIGHEKKKFYFDGARIFLIRENNAWIFPVATNRTYLPLQSCRVPAMSY